MTGTFELAPAAVVRVASWPIESLGAFGDAEARRSIGRSFEEGYEQTLARERACLWERAADGRFLKGLAVASDSMLARSLRHGGPAAPRDKRTRHLETSLYRYLARACTRTAPQGLWAGVCLASFGERERFSPARPRVDFTPDLTPFATAMAALAERPPYRAAAHFRLTPTLRRRGGGRWTYLARSRRGDVEVRELSSDAALAPLVERVGAAGTGTLEDLADRSGTPRAVLERLAEASVLVGGLGFPARFVTTWEALAVAGDALLGADRSAWIRAVSVLEQLAVGLSSRFHALSPQALAEELAHGREPVTTLFAALGVGGEPPGVPLRCDLGAPFSVTLGPETRRELLAGLSSHEHELLRSTRERRRALAALVASRPLDLGDAVAVLSSEVLADHGADDNPWGCLVARLGDRRTSVLGIDESPVRPFARFTAVLGVGNEVERWVEKLFARIETEHGVVACDLTLPFDPNPNVLARASLARPAFDPWGVSGPDLRGAHLCRESGALVLRAPGVGRVALFAATMSAIVPCDPMAGPLAVAGFADAAQPAPASNGGGAWVRPGQTALTAVEIGTLVKLPRRERYARWLELASVHDWPEMVAITFDARRPLVVPTSSPLAIEAAFEGARGARAIVVEEADVSARVCGTDGHHVADVMVPFARTPHTFSALSPEVNE